MKIRTCIIAASLVFFSASAGLANSQPEAVPAGNVPAAEISQPADAPQNAATVKAPKTDAPSAFVPKSVFTFENVLDGEETLHDFIVRNKGTAPLRIERVRTG